MKQQKQDLISKRHLQAMERLDEGERRAIWIVKVHVPVPKGHEITDYVPVAAKALAQVALDSVLPSAELSKGERLQFDVNKNSLCLIDANGIPYEVCCELPNEEVFFSKVMCAYFASALNQEVHGVGSYRFSGDHRFHEWEGE